MPERDLDASFYARHLDGRGHTLGGAVALAYLPAGSDTTGRFEVDCAGTMVAATLSDKPFYDPGNQRLTA